MLQYDRDRLARIGMPEAIFCLGKTDEQLVAIITELADAAQPVLFTRLDATRLRRVATPLVDRLDVDPASETAFLNGCLEPRGGVVAVVTAGTADLRVAIEVQRTLEFSGITTQLFADVGVAGLWRLEQRLEEIRSADVVVVAAGMDGALASVLGGLVAAPVVAVPTSVGYGVAHGGEAALHSMLTSCAQGVVVTNIDNGFGAACAAVRILGRSS